MAIYTVIPAKRPAVRVSPVLAEPVPARDEPQRPQSPTEPNRRVAVARMDGQRDPG
jgi:hypothetical protein